MGERTVPIPMMLQSFRRSREHDVNNKALAVYVLCTLHLVLYPAFVGPAERVPHIKHSMTAQGLIDQ